MTKGSRVYDYIAKLVRSGAKMSIEEMVDAAEREFPDMSHAQKEHAFVVAAEELVERAREHDDEAD